MKNMVKKAMGVMFLFALTVTVNAGGVGTIPQVDDGGISVMSDAEPVTEFHF